MTPSERLRAERKIDELLAHAFKLRMQLRVDDFEQAGSPVPTVWQTVQRIAETRHAVAAAMVEATSENKD